MFWIILIIVQLVLWYLTFFKSKKMTREKEGTRWGKEWGAFKPTDGRFKFALWQVMAAFLLCLIPILGLVILILVSLLVASALDCDFDDERPIMFLSELLTKKI